MKIKKLIIITSLFTLSMLFFTQKSKANTSFFNVCPSGNTVTQNQNCQSTSYVFYSNINMISSNDFKTISISTQYTGTGGVGYQSGYQSGNQGGNQGTMCGIIDNAPREYAVFGSNSTLIQNNPGNSFYDSFVDFFASSTGGNPGSVTFASFYISKMFRSPFEWRLNGKTMTSNGTYYIANVFKCPNDYNGNQFNGLMNSPFLVYLPIEIGTLGTSTPTITITPSIDLNTR